MLGNEIHALAKKLFPINRSLTGEGVRQTLNILKGLLSDLKIHEVPTGTKVFDWEIPREWRVSDAWVKTPTGEKICEFSKNNLHLLGYSTPVHQKMSLSDLQHHLYSLPEQPEAIPYMTSYYKERWGFCITQAERDRLVEGQYEVFIDSELFEGSLTYGELIIKGKSESEVLLSTYICHPSMANNELSGPCVATFLASWLQAKEDLYHTYRIVFIPETIGSITYLSQNLTELKNNVIAGFNITCIGDNRCYSYLPSREGDTLSDQAAQHVLKHLDQNYVRYSWHDRGSDERQYCAPHVNLPIATIMRSKYGCYDEYHTSLDNLENVVTPEGLQGGYNALKLSIEAIENNFYPTVTVCCEPQLGKRGLYPTLSTKNSGSSVRLMTDIISWADGRYSLLDIANKCDVPIWELYPIVNQLVEHDLLHLERG